MPRLNHCVCVSGDCLHEKDSAGAAACTATVPDEWYSLWDCIWIDGQFAWAAKEAVHPEEAIFIFRAF